MYNTSTVMSNSEFSIAFIYSNPAARLLCAEYYLRQWTSAAEGSRRNAPMTIEIGFSSINAHYVLLIKCYSVTVSSSRLQSL